MNTDDEIICIQYHVVGKLNTASLMQQEHSCLVLGRYRFESWQTDIFREFESKAVPLHVMEAHGDALGSRWG
jgi:hypothetical protein